MHFKFNQHLWWTMTWAYKVQYIAVYWINLQCTQRGYWKNHTAFLGKCFFLQWAGRIILGPPKHVLHLIWSAFVISTAIRTPLKEVGGAQIVRKRRPKYQRTTNERPYFSPFFVHPPLNVTMFKTVAKLLFYTTNFNPKLTKFFLLPNILQRQNTWATRF